MTDSAELHKFFRLLDISRIKKSTKDKEDLKVTLKKSRTKGVGLYATKPIKKGQIVAYYKMKLFKYNTYNSPTKGMYAFTAYNKDGSENESLIGDLYLGSIPAPSRNIPYWALFSNEPSKGQDENAYIDEDISKNFRSRNKLKAGETIIYKLVATRNIKPGEEITWCYGSGYYRNYKAPLCE